MTPTPPASAGRSVSALRLAFKKAFTRYYLDLCSAGVATPTQAYEACARFLAAREEEMGPRRARADLAQDILKLTGEIEQDLRRQHRDLAPACLEKESMDERVAECVRAAVGRAATE